MNRSATALPLFAGLRPSGYALLVSVLGLTLFGLVALSSAGRAFGSDPLFILKRQAMWLAIAAMAFVVAYHYPLERLRGQTPWLALGGLGLLTLVLVPGVGVSVNGARRWLDLGLMRLQPSDVVKPVFALVLARCLADNQRHLRTFGRGFIGPCMVIGVFCVLILVEPDFGTAALFGVVGFAMLVVVGVRLRYLIPSVLAAVGAFAYLVANDPVRRARITAFMDVEGNKQEGAYQLWQGMLAFGVGGTSGVGLGNGRQQHSFLPEAHTDFIFPIIGEELGLAATLGIVALFALAFLCLVWNLRKAPNLFEFALALSCGLFLVLQALVNMGVVTGLLPTKGMSLPFISYGGSNLVVMYVLTGLMLNCFRRWDASPITRPREL